MNYSLWRGNIELGRLRLALSDSDDDYDQAVVHAMLEVASGDVTIESVQQTRFEFGDRAVVFEHEIPDLDALSASTVEHSSATSGVGPRAMSPQEAMGIPADRVLTLRDENGEIVVSDMISVSRMPAVFMQNKTLLARCAAAGIQISAWSVAAFRRSLGDEQSRTAS